MPQLPRKFEKLLNKNGYAIETIFTFKGICKYVRVISLKTGDWLMLYIDPDFSFTPPEDTSSVNIKLVDFTVDTEDVVEKFNDYPDTKDVEGKYRVPISVKLEDGENFEDKVENKYKHKIFLRDIEKPKIVGIKACFRQLQRLSLMTQDLPYKLCIFDGVYMFVVEDDDFIKCYQLSMSNSLQIAVVIGLEYFYKKIESVRDDSATIKESLYKLITKNHSGSFNVIKSLIKSLQESFSSADGIALKHKEFDVSIGKTSELLEKVNVHLYELLEKYTNLETTKPSEEVYVHEKKRLEDKIHSGEALKQKLLNYMVSLKEQKDRMFLLLDQIEFDTSIFMNCINKRIKEFDEMKK